MNQSRSTFRSALFFVLKPVVRFCVKHSLPIQEFIDHAKTLYVEEAARLLEEESTKSNVSRISAVTGLQRKDVLRLLKKSGASAEPVGLIDRILGQWQLDKRFSNGKGRARPLSCEGLESEFSRLVQAVSSDLNSGTVLKELIRIGAATRKGSKVSLAARVFVPTKREHELALELLSADQNDLITAATENIFARSSVPNLHGRTEFDNVDPSKVAEIREWLLKEGSDLHQRAREFIGRFDRDIQGKNRGTEDNERPGLTVSLGTFSRIKE